MEQQRFHVARKVTLFSAATNLFLAIGKIIVGYVGYSHALIADGMHSFSDLISDALVIIAAKAGDRLPDEGHPYGHRRIETMGAIIISLLLIIVAGTIVYDALEHIFLNRATQTPEIIVLGAALVSIVANEWLYRYTLKEGKKINSSLLITNAWHHRGDALSSVIVFLAAGGAILGIPYFDALGATLIGALIFKMGIQMMFGGLKELMDAAVDPETLAHIQRVIKSVSGVVMVHQLRTRLHSGNILVDVHIIVDPYISVSEGHHIGEAVHLALIHEVSNVEDVTVHIDPEDDSDSMPSMSLPNRRVLEEKLSARWQHLPHYPGIKRITLHYLAGKLIVEISIPYSEDSYKNLPQLIQQYQSAALDIPEISEVIVQIVPE
jgi:cation diffusion facilitator family transporter